MRQPLISGCSTGGGVAEPLPAGYKGELKRAKRLANDDVLPEQEGERQLPGQERMPTWHRESSDRSPGLLRFELERGSRTAAQGSAPREGDAADQALAIAQGRSHARPAHWRRLRRAARGCCRARCRGARGGRCRRVCDGDVAGA